MEPYRPRTHHRARIAAVAFSILMLIGLLSPAAMAQPTHDKRESGGFDLAAMTLLPGDLHDEEVSLWFGWTQMPAETREDPFLAGADVDLTEQVMDESGWQWRYYSTLYFEEFRNDDQMRLVRTGVTEFSSARGAGDWMEFVSDDDFAPGSDELRPVESDARIGEAATVLEVDISRDQDGFLIFFQRGRIVADLLYYDNTGDDVALDDLEQLAGVVDRRIDAELDGEGRGIAQLALHLSPDRGAPFYDQFEGYIRQDGITAPMTGDTSFAFDYREERHGDAVDAYFVAAGIQIADEPIPDTDPYYSLRLLRFADPAAAADWVDFTPGFLAENGFENEVIEDAATFGDHSVTISVPFTRDGADEEIRSYVVILSVGEFAAWVELAAPKDVPLSIVEDFAAAEVACLEQGACAGPIEIPEALLAQPQ